MEQDKTEQNSEQKYTQTNRIFFPLPMKKVYTQISGHIFFEQGKPEYKNFLY